MTDQERSQKIEAALQTLIGRLEFRIVILEAELEAVRAELEAARSGEGDGLRLVEPR